MTRYLLAPSKKDFELLPIEKGLHKRKITLPDGLYMNRDIFDQVKDPEKLKRFLITLSKNRFGRMKNGQVNNEHCLNIDFDGAVISYCNKDFSEKFENFYSALNCNGINY